jgi:hypothetical protein
VDKPELDRLPLIEEDFIHGAEITDESIGWLINELYILRAEIMGLLDPRASHPAGKGLIAEDQ